MREPTQNDIDAAARALYHVMHLSRLALHAMENVELVALQAEEPQGSVMFALENVLETIMTDAEAAAEKLTDVRFGANHA